MNYEVLTAQIDRTAILHNCRILRSFIPNTCRMCVAVKANAYGHGVELVLPALKVAGVDMLAVSMVDEAIELRGCKWQGPILLMGSELSIYTGPEKAEIAEWLVANDITVTLAHLDDLNALTKAALKLEKTFRVHVMLDSGMSRMGLYEPELIDLISTVLENNLAILEGIYTHFATAYARDKSFAHEQLEAFTGLLELLRQHDLDIPVVHAANSAAALDLPASHFNMIRPGISVYGCHSSTEMDNRPDLQPALKVVSRIVMVKHLVAGTSIGYGCSFRATNDITVGIVPIGYADGYDLGLSNRGRMTVAGHSAAVLGRVSMDQTVIDLSNVLHAGINVQPGQEVVIIDNHPVSCNCLEALAAELRTIPYEIMTRLGPRVKRVPADSPQEQFSIKGGKLQALRNPGK